MEKVEKLVAECLPEPENISELNCLSADLDLNCYFISKLSLFWQKITNSIHLVDVLKEANHIRML